MFSCTGSRRTVIKKQARRGYSNQLQFKTCESRRCNPCARKTIVNSSQQQPDRKTKNPLDFRSEGLCFFGFLAEWTGLEPATPGVTGRYSNQLNYHSTTAKIIAWLFDRLQVWARRCRKKAPRPDRALAAAHQTPRESGHACSSLDGVGDSLVRHDGCHREIGLGGLWHW